MSSRALPILSALSLFAVLGPTPLVTVTRPAPNYSQTITATPMGLAAKLRQNGSLEFQEGWVLNSRHTGFGGFSAMALTGERRFLLASDTGLLARFTLQRDGSTSPAFLQFIPDGPGDPATKANRDIESLVTSADGDTVWVGFEQANAIWKYRADLSAVEGHAKPPAMQDWPGNSGPEAMTRLSDGRFLVLSEGADTARGLSALLFAGDPTRVPQKATSFDYDPQGKGAPTDVIQLPDGRILILHRSVSLWEGFVSTIAIADIKSIGKGSVLRSHTIARFAPPYISENFEGMAFERDGGDLMLWLVSDHNFAGFQRSLLVKYRIDPGALANKKAAP